MSEDRAPGTMWCLKCDKDCEDERTCPRCGAKTIAIDFPSDPCAECVNKIQRGGGNHYTVYDHRHGGFVFDVERARALAGEHGKRFLLDAQTLTQLLQVNRTTLGHLPHIPEAQRTEPGLLIEIELGTVTTICLIDGSHRGVQALLDEKPFPILMLPWEYASQAVLSFTPAGGHHA